MLTITMGAFVSELLVRPGGARWIYSARDETAAVELSSGNICFPVNEVS